MTDQKETQQSVKIYGFFNSVDAGRDAVSIAISEFGEIIANHYSSSERWSRHDLGMDGECTWHHDEYDERFPDGWEYEFVSMENDRDVHKGLQTALDRHKEKEKSMWS